MDFEQKYQKDPGSYRVKILTETDSVPRPENGSSSWQVIAKPKGFSFILGIAVLLGIAVVLSIAVILGIAVILTSTSILSYSITLTISIPCYGKKVVNGFGESLVENTAVSALRMTVPSPFPE